MIFANLTTIRPLHGAAATTGTAPAATIIGAKRTRCNVLQQGKTTAATSSATNVICRAVLRSMIGVCKLSIAIWSFSSSDQRRGPFQPPNQRLTPQSLLATEIASPSRRPLTSRRRRHRAIPVTRQVVCTDRRSRNRRPRHRCTCSFAYHGSLIGINALVFVDHGGCLCRRRREQDSSESSRDLRQHGSSSSPGLLESGRNGSHLLFRSRTPIGYGSRKYFAAAILMPGLAARRPGNFRPPQRPFR